MFQNSQSYLFFLITKKERERKREKVIVDTHMCNREKLKLICARPSLKNIISYQISIATIGLRVYRIRSMALLIPKGDKKRRSAIRRSRSWVPFRSGQCFIRDIGSDRRALWLLIRYLSSSGAFRASYDASIWPPVGIASALRRNSVSASILRLADAQSAPSPLSSLIPRIFPLLIRECRARILAKLRLRLWLAYKGAFWFYGTFNCGKVGDLSTNDVSHL